MRIDEYKPDPDYCNATQYSIFVAVMKQFVAIASTARCFSGAGGASPDPEWSSRSLQINPEAARKCADTND
jgi:hypothetical protein